jgi:branched-chain amino acid transport system permease protein
MGLPAADALEYAIRGIPIGCVFALLAVGLVLNFKTSGVFNLAFAAQAYASATVFYMTRKEYDWPLVPAAVLAILVVGPGIGILLDRFLFRYQRTASPLAKLITSLGLLVAVPELVKLWVGDDAMKNPPPLWPVQRTDEFLWPQGSRFVLDAGQITTVTSTAVVVLGLTLLFRYSALGLRMRAVVESPRLLSLQGVDAEHVSLVSWALTSALAGLAGVLIAPLFAQLSSLDFFTLLVAAVVACVVGNLSSIPGAFLGGLLLGIFQAELAGFLPTDSVLASGLRPSLPFIVLFGLLLVRRSVRASRQLTDPLAGVDPPPAPPAASLRPPWLTAGTRLFAVAAGLAGLAVCLWVLDEFWLSLVTGGVCLGVILLSVVLTTGIGGTISLCQGTFAAIGAFTTAQLVAHAHFSVLGAMVAGALVAAAAGAMLSGPVIRLAGIYPALATLAFALMFEGVFVPLGWVSGGPTPLPVPRPVVGSVDFANAHAFLLLAVGLLALLGTAVVAIRQGTTGRFLLAIQGSDAGAASIGINTVRPRSVVFILGAGIAGFGGGLLASFYGQANYNLSFAFMFALVWLVLVIAAGARSVQSAVICGISFYVIPQLLTELFGWPGNYLLSHPHTGGLPHAVLGAVKPEWASSVAFILFAIGALTYAKHPEGVIEAHTSAGVRLILAVTGRRSRSRPPRPSPRTGPLDRALDDSLIAAEADRRVGTAG